MNRVVKFRAWDNGVMHQWNELQHTPPSGWNTERIHFMQFTGLTDKNGKEIYEGDVLLVPDEDVVPVTDEGQGPIEECPHIVQVTFKEGEFGFLIKATDYGETGWFTFRTWRDVTDPADIEVIGNIYENPNLIDHA